jgi:hypothetical protein
VLFLPRFLKDFSVNGKVSQLSFKEIDELRNAKNYICPSLFSSKYNSSTCLLAQSVFLKNFKEELMVGLLLKQFILMIFPKAAHPK